MWTLLGAFVGALRSLFRTRRELALENLALRQQVGVLMRTLGGRRPRLGVWDRGLWVFLSQRWAGWREVLAIVEPATVIPELLGHESIEMTLLYAHLTPDVRRAAVRLLDRKGGSRGGAGGRLKRKGPGGPGPRWSGKRDLNIYDG